MSDERASGWVTVPKEPTQEMVRAAYQYQGGAINAGFAQAYRTMIAAAPSASRDSGEGINRLPAYLSCPECGKVWCLKHVPSKPAPETPCPGCEGQGYMHYGNCQQKPAPDAVREAVEAFISTLRKAVSTTPPVRADREAIKSILVEMIQRQSSKLVVVDYEAMIDKLLSLDVQPGAGEEK